MARIRELLGTTRLLSLIGPGGTGKTRLAVESATAIAGELPDGAWLVELAPVTDPTLVVHAVAETFEVREQADVPLMDSVVAQLADQRVLLVLDNCEHLIEAAASVAERLLVECPGLRVLATSREPLHVPGEVVYRVPPLQLPETEGSDDPAHLGGFAAIRLFTERAASAAPEFALSEANARDVAQLCARLDGLPLAIELAASRVALFPVATIVERLDDRFRMLVGGSRTAPSRQQTLRAALEWSYDLLDSREQALLRWLSLFVGGIALDAAEQVCGVGDDVIGLIAQLVEKSLVHPDETGDGARYRLLETIREYGMERIGRDERRDVEARHAEWFLHVAEEADRALPRPDLRHAVIRLEAEHDNIRAAVERSLASDPDRALRMAGAMWGFWLYRGFLAEGRRWLDRALAAAPGRTAAQARALLGAATLASRSGLLRDGVELAERSLAIYRDLGDVRSCCRVLHALAPPTFSRDDLPGAERIFRESLVLATANDFEAGRAAALQGLGIIRWYRGHRDEAESLLHEALDGFRSIADPSELAPPPLGVGEFVVPEPETGGVRIVFEETFALFTDLPVATYVGVVLSNLGMIARGEGDLGRARAYMEEALAVVEGLGDERSVGRALGRLASVAAAEGDHARAQELLERSLEIRRRIRDSREVTVTEANLGNLAIAQKDFERARQLLERSRETFRRRGDRWGYSATLGHLASLALAEGDRDEARRLLEQNLALTREIGRARWTAWTLTQLAALARMYGAHDRAEALIDEALTIFRQIEELRGIEHCRAFKSARPDRILATVLFTDLVGSTEKVVELGDQRWKALLHEFLESARTKIADFGGREVDAAGDGIFALFTSPTQAIPAAQAIQAAARRLGLDVRSGIHTGECEVVGDAVRGIAVHIGARVGARAEPGEVVVTRTVRDLLMGSGIGFEDRGSHALKGIDGEWDLFAVREEGEGG